MRASFRPLWLVAAAGLLGVGTSASAESVVGVSHGKWTVHCFSGVNDRGTPYCMIDYRLPSESGWNISSSESAFVVTSWGRNARTCRRIEIREDRIRPSWREVHPARDMPASDKVADAAIAAMRSHLPLIGQCRKGQPPKQPTIAVAFEQSIPGLQRAIADVEGRWLAAATRKRRHQ